MTMYCQRCAVLLSGWYESAPLDHGAAVGFICRDCYNYLRTCEAIADEATRDLIDPGPEDEDLRRREDESDTAEVKKAEAGPDA